MSEAGVPCELLIYDEYGHGLATLENRLGAYPRAIEFLTGRPATSRVLETGLTFPIGHFITQVSRFWRFWRRLRFDLDGGALSS